VIFGPMFSGKTTELMRRIKRFQIANHKCMVVKYAKDVRYNESALATHDKQTLAAVSCTNLSSLAEKAKDFNIIGIDEGQFFPDTVEFAERMANLGKVVIVAALDATYQRVGFGNILNLVPLAESVIKLTAVCMICFQDASYTQRTSQETALEVIGGSDKYIAVCRGCYKATASPQKKCPLQTLDENLADNKIVEVTKKLSLDNLQQDANQSKLDNWLKKASQNKGLQKVDQNKVLQKVDQNKENRKA